MDSTCTNIQSLNRTFITNPRLINSQLHIDTRKSRPLKVIIHVTSRKQSEDLQSSTHKTRTDR